LTIKEIAAMNDRQQVVLPDTLVAQLIENAATKLGPFVKTTTGLK
jgi:hypothetical protein